MPTCVISSWQMTNLATRPTLEPNTNLADQRLLQSLALAQKSSEWLQHPFQPRALWSLMWIMM
eukprot:11245928-Karenia_brevis.AAC.1